MSIHKNFNIGHLCKYRKVAISNKSRLAAFSDQGCILLTSLSVISSKFIQKFAQKCHYFTLIEQSVAPDNC